MPDGDALKYFLTKLFEGARRNPPLSIVLFEIADLDDYVAIEGPEVKPEALSTAAGALVAETRAMNVVGRLDDHTFIVLLQGEDVSGAWSFVRRVMEEIETRSAPWDGRIHLNAGISAYAEGLTDSADLLHRGRKALAAARSLGGSAAVVYGGAPERALGISGMVILEPDGTLHEVHRTV